MNKGTIPNFHINIDDFQEELDSLRQNRLLDEGSFIRFASDRGIPVSGVVKGDPGDFNRRGWLYNDGTNYYGGPLFHPFRMYTLFNILKACKLNISTSSTIHRDSFIEFIERVLPCMPNLEQIREMATQKDQIANLAIILEPIYWPDITGRVSISGKIFEDDFRELLKTYRDNVLKLVASIDLAYLHEIYQSLCLDAANLDSNDSLYLLLRLSKWNRRERLKGHIAGSLWFRHMAEVIRRAFENVYPERWREEDDVFGRWHQGTRTVIYGSERPIDDELHSKPYLAFHYGLFTGSVVRWYVEGDTEYYAILKVLPEPSKRGIELVNLYGNIKSGKQNVAFKLKDSLEEDNAHRRFSIISFDTDLKDNSKLIRRQVKEKRIVGFIAAHNPDFEFSNFCISELSDIAARINEANGISGTDVRNADWSGVNSARAFEERYRNVSHRNLKGKEWGEALAAYAIEHPNRRDNRIERPFWREIRAALQSRFADYDFQKSHYDFDPDTFELIKSNP